MRGLRFFPAIFLLVAASVATAVAQPTKSAGWHEHDGLYLRAALGPARLDLRRNTEREGSGASLVFMGDSSSVRGFGGLVELSVGGTPVDKLAIAGTVLLHRLEDAELTLANGSDVSLGTGLSFAMLAPTIDIFPNPTGGFHLGGGVGVATADATVSDPPGGFGGVGPAATLAAGYDWWIGRDWSLGLLLRGIGAVITGEHPDEAVIGREDDTVTVVAIAFTALYH